MGAPVRSAVLATVVLLALAAMFAGGFDGLRPPGGIHVSLPHDRASSAPADGGARHAKAPAQRSRAPGSSSSSALGGDARDAFRWIFLAALGLGCATVLVATLRFSLVRRRDRLRIRPSPVVPGGPVAEAPEDDLADALERGIAELDRGSVRNAVVAAWIRLEEHAARVGVPRHPEDTPTEFVERALSTSASLDAGALADLAALYLEARFSTHPIGEAERDAARSCLRRLTGRSVEVAP